MLEAWFNNPLLFKKILCKGRLLVAFLPLVLGDALALEFSLPIFGNTIGEYQTIEAQENDTLLKIAEKFDIGAKEMVLANPKLKGKKLKVGTLVTIPSKFYLPSGPKQGIVLNLAVMRLFFYHPNESKVSTFPVGIGRKGWATPLGETTIVLKRPNPTWRPPDSIRREAESNGKILPLIVPPGPNNPLGKYAMNLGISGIMIHGTNSPASVGLNSSHGCIRMYADDIEALFSMTDVGTPVRIVYEPHQDL